MRVFDPPSPSRDERADRLPVRLAMRGFCRRLALIRRFAPPYMRRGLSSPSGCEPGRRFPASAGCAVDLLVSKLTGGAGRSRVLIGGADALGAPLTDRRRRLFDHPRGRRRFASDGPARPRGEMSRAGQAQDKRGRSALKERRMGRCMSERRAASDGLPRRWDGASLGPGGKALLKPYIRAAWFRRSIILRAGESRGPGWTGPIFSSGYPRGRGGHGSHPGRGERALKTRSLFGRLRRASRPPPQDAGLKDSATARRRACAPWRRWRCA